MVDPCPLTSLMPTEINDGNPLTTTVRAAVAVTFDVTIHDEVSLTQGVQDGVTLCGLRSYILTSGLTTDFASLVQTTNQGDTLRISSINHENASTDS